MVSKSSNTANVSQRLLKEGLISQDQLTIAEKYLRESEDPNSTSLGAILVDLGFITEKTLGELMVESAGVAVFNPKTTVLDAKLIKQMPESIAQRYKVMPVAVEDNVLKLAMSDVYNMAALDQVGRIFMRYKIQPVYCAEADLLELIDRYYAHDLTIEGILREIETGMAESSKKLGGETEGYVNPMVRLVDSLLIDAIKTGASDVHFEPDRAFLRLRYRIDGTMQQIRSLHKEYWTAIAVRIKIISGMNIAETRVPQNGRITYNVLGREVDFRVSTQPTVHGENIVLRILDRKRGLMTLEDLGLSDHNVNLLKKLIKRPEGVILVTGPTGSGKSTTLYSILNHLNSPNLNIMTLEDPVEYQLPLIRQTSVRPGHGLDFAEGLRAIMRQDPDIISVGEIRDEETAQMTIRAAMTGHQVYSTLHTNDAIGAIPRLVDIGINPHILSGALICVIAQRLVRKLCSQCRTEYTASNEECRILGIDPSSAPVLHRAGGCEACGYKGYKGRVCVAEIIPVDRGMDELISTGATRQIMLTHAREQGFRSMQEDGIFKVLDGVTDLEEMINSINMTELL